MVVPTGIPVVVLPRAFDGTLLGRIRENHKWQFTKPKRYRCGIQFTGWWYRCGRSQTS